MISRVEESWFLIWEGILIKIGPANQRTDPIHIVKREKSKKMNNVQISVQ
jgi:hypothetical protein